MPGTGKDALSAGAVWSAKPECRSPLGSDFVEMFSSYHIDPFEQAQNSCASFVDETDAVGRQRGAGFKVTQTLNQASKWTVFGDVPASS